MSPWRPTAGPSPSERTLDVATAEETVVAAHVEDPAPEPAGKRKTQKSSKRRQPQGIRSVLGLTQGDSDGPASLLAAVAALEAEEHVEPIVAPIVDAPQTFDQPSVVTPVAAAPIVTAHSFDPLVSYIPSLETSVVRPPVVEPPPAQAHSEDLARFVVAARHAVERAGASRQHVQRGTFRRTVTELDNSLLTTSFDEAVRPLTTNSDPFSTTSVVNNTPRAEGRSWPVWTRSSRKPRRSNRPLRRTCQLLQGLQDLQDLTIHPHRLRRRYGKKRSL